MGWMHGMPQAIKDLSNVQGLRTTLGSPLMKDFVASEDGLMAQRIKAAGAIVIGKTNTPEFGLGSHTFNEVFGPTRNAWNPDKSAGGSSGGAAVALAQRMLPVADGSDFMGSLRNPAGWNHVFGLRPSQGRVPMWPANDVWLAQLGTEGPMGRSVRDIAMLLSVQAGHDPRAPLSIAQSGSAFAAPLAALGAVLLGARHPVTEALVGANTAAAEASWGRWYRWLRGEARGGLAAVLFQCGDGFGQAGQRRACAGEVVEGEIERLAVVAIEEHPAHGHGVMTHVGQLG